MSRRHRLPKGLYEPWGRVRMPLPQRMALTDRTTGAVFVLSHAEATADVELEPYLPRRHTDANIYDAFNEPRAESNANYRLVLDGGILAMELAPLEMEAGQGRHQVGRGQSMQPRILTRRGFQRRTLHLDVDAFGQLTIEEEEI